MGIYLGVLSEGFNWDRKTSPQCGGTMPWVRALDRWKGEFSLGSCILLSVCFITANDTGLHACCHNCSRSPHHAFRTRMSNCILTPWDKVNFLPQDALVRYFVPIKRKVSYTEENWYQRAGLLLSIGLLVRFLSLWKSFEGECKRVWSRGLCKYWNLVSSA